MTLLTWSVSCNSRHYLWTVLHFQFKVLQGHGQHFNWRFRFCMIIIPIRFTDMNTRFLQSRSKHDKNNMYVKFGKYQIICMIFRNKTKDEARLSVSKQFQTYFALLKCTYIFKGSITSVNLRVSAPRWPDGRTVVLHWHTASKSELDNYFSPQLFSALCINVSAS